MTKYSKLKSSPSAAVRANLDYPVIDTDVHTNDFTPALEDYIAHYGGVKLVDELRKAESSRLNSKTEGKDWYQQTPEERQNNRTIRSPWWARVTRNTLDLATYTLPALLYERQAEQGSDYSVLFPNNALAAAGASKENRQLLQRAINHYHADIYRPYSDRLTVVAGIPMTTPQEAIEELEFAVNTLGLNHIGHFGDGSQAFAKALFFGGVTRRFPQLRVGMLEGGADWGAHVYIHLVDRFSKRSLEGLQNYNPDLTNADELFELFAEYGREITQGYSLSKEELTKSVLGSSFNRHSRSPVGSELEDFGAAGIQSIEDIRDRWVNSFFFGSESDDRTIAAAFNDKANPLGVKLNAIYSSDVGHWDVPDLTAPLAESWDLVREGVISEDDFKAYVFGNPYKFYTQANPDFFKGTAVESKLPKTESQPVEKELVAV